MDYKTELSSKVKKVIYSKRIKLVEVSKNSGVGYRTLRDFINDAENTTLRNICKIANGLGIQLDFEKTKQVIATNIKTYRESQGIVMTQLARLSKMSHASLGNYERAQGNITLDRICEISNALKISPFNIYDFAEFDSTYVELEDLEVKYSKPTFDTSSLDKEFSLSKDLFNSACVEVEKGYVIDGDTIGIKYKNKNYRVRLLVIDTPETIKRSEMWGEKAKLFNKYLISKATKVFIQLDNKAESMDQWKRILGWVWLEIDGEMKLLNSMLVQSGLATVKYIRSEESLFVHILKEQEQKSKKEKRIIWGYKYLDPYWDYQLNQIKETYYVIQKENKYVEVSDYLMKDWKLSSTATKFRTKIDCEYFVKHLDDSYKILEKI